MKTFVITEARFAKETIKNIMGSINEVYDLVVYNDTYIPGIIEEICNSGYDYINTFTYTSSKDVVCSILDNCDDDVVFDISDNFFGYDIAELYIDKIDSVVVMFKGEDITNQLNTD